MLKGYFSEERETLKSSHHVYGVSGEYRKFIAERCIIVLVFGCLTHELFKDGSRVFGPLIC